MKKILILLVMGFPFSVTCQVRHVDLKTCINSALTSRTTLKIKNAELSNAVLEKTIVSRRYLPQLSLNYQYRYNALIQRQIIPVGLFRQEPDDRLQAIEFGTNWQQNAGITGYQPLFDPVLNSEIAENGIKERIAKFDVQISEDELKFEVTRSFSKIYILTCIESGFALDTARTFKSYQLIKSNFDEGRVLKSELNKALLNHHNSILDELTTKSELAREKFYLAFLTGMPPDDLLLGEFDFAPLQHLDDTEETVQIRLREITNYRQFEIQEGLVRQQIDTEKRKKKPNIGLEGFLGANQYSNSFNPVLRDSWFGNSYVGLTIKMPLLQSWSTSKRIDQLRNETRRIAFEREDFEATLNKNVFQTRQSITALIEKMRYAKMNIDLITENLSIYKERFKAGQFSAADLNLQEIELRKERNIYSTLNADLVDQQIALLKYSGNLNRFISSLR